MIYAMRPLRFCINLTLDGIYDQRGLFAKRHLNDFKAAIEHQ